MKEIVPAPPAVVRNETAEMQSLFQRHVVPTYARFDLVLSHGSGNRIWDVAGKRTWISAAASPSPSLGHALPAITETLTNNRASSFTSPISITTRRKAGWRRRSATSSARANVFSATAARKRTRACSSSPANSAMTKDVLRSSPRSIPFMAGRLRASPPPARKKSKKALSPPFPASAIVPFNDLAAVRAAISPATAAIIIEGIQGEGGVNIGHAGISAGPAPVVR